MVRDDCELGSGGEIERPTVASAGGRLMAEKDTRASEYLMYTPLPEPELSRQRRQASIRAAEYATDHNELKDFLEMLGLTEDGYAE